MNSRRSSAGKNIHNNLFIICLVWVFCSSLASATEHCVKEDFVVALDIGHTKNHPGGISARGVSEFYFNKRLAQLLSEELVRQGFTQTFRINENGSDITLTERTHTAGRNNADLLLSIHHDSVQPRYLSSWIYQGKQYLYSDIFKGYSIFYSEKNEKARESFFFAQILGAELRSSGFVPTLHHAKNIAGENRDLVDKEHGIYRFDSLTVLRLAEMPAVLLECGIIVNREEELLLSNPVYQKAFVSSITRAIEQACQSGIHW